MKIGARLHDISYNSIAELNEICLQHEIDGLQVVLKKSFEEMFEKNDVESFLNLNLNIFLFGSYFNLIHPDELSKKQGFKNFQKTLLFMKENQFIGTETGSMNKDEWTYNELNHSEECFNSCIKSIQKLLKNKNNILIEPVYDHVIYDISKIEKMYEIIKNENLYLIIDVANLLNINNYLQYEKIFTEIITKFLKKIKIFHFKNFIIQNNQKKGVVLNEGIIDYQKIIKIIFDNNLEHIPIIVEELVGEQLYTSIKYIKKIGETYEKIL